MCYHELTLSNERNMKAEEQVDKREGRAYKGDKLKFWSKLRVQMTISYVGVSVVSALLVELLLALLFFLIILRLPFVDQTAMNTANHVAQVYALEAAVQAGGNALDPRTTFQAGQSSSLTLPAGDSTVDPKTIAVALLIAPNGQVLASSDPEQYPLAASATHLLPAQAPII